MKDNQALIVVDVQKDFLETGALPVKDGSQVVPVINRISPKFKHVVFEMRIETMSEFHQKGRKQTF